MKRIILVLLIFSTTFVSCMKEKFPLTSDLAGSWIEQTNNSFKSKLVFKNENLYFYRLTFTDTLIYNLDQKEEFLNLRLKNYPSSGESSHKILINTQKKELTIWGLFPSINTSVTLFKKE